MKLFKASDEAYTYLTSGAKAELLFAVIDILDERMAAWLHYDE